MNKIDKLYKIGVYKAIYGTCDWTHVGQTGWKFHICFSEYINSSVEEKTTTCDLDKHD